MRIVLKGLSDTLEHLLPFTVASLAWWVTVFTVFLAPGATVALFRMADPRIPSDLDRPSLRENAVIARRELRRGWSLEASTFPIIAVLVWNLRFYGLSRSRVSVLSPFWLALLVLAIFMTATAFSNAALFDASWRAALKGAVIQTGRHLPTVVAVAIVFAPILLLGSILVVPIFMFLPAAAAAVINRFVLDSRGVAIADPLLPTAERSVEDARARERRRFGP